LTFADRRSTSNHVIHSIATGSAPKALGPYSQGIRAGQFVFVSGQVPIDPATGELISGSIGDQTRRALQNIGEILNAAGSSFQQVVRTTVYLADLADFPAMNETYATYFTAPQPARSTIQAAKLPKGARIEIDAIAFLG
jgi:2-iminobutanoate/2-iminopropanoate deaminase